jgi:S1-C subfamily serine protease
MGRFSLSIPVHLFSDHRQDLPRFGRVPGRARRAWIGVFAVPTAGGVAVAGLVPDGPAAREGGREATDRGSEFHRGCTRAKAYDHLWKCAAGAVVRLGILRDGDHLTVEVESMDRAEFYR